MFDWNDEELNNIIWGEAGESEDHIVPYPDQIEEKPPVLFGDSAKKETNQDASNIGPLEQKTPTSKSENRVELDGISKYDLGDSATCFGVDSWPGGHDSTSSNAEQTDQGSMGNATNRSVKNSSHNGSSREEAAEFDKSSEIFENPNPPDEGEQSDFVDYSWANIGSFDDLDRIFSNNDPIFGDMSIGNANELWSSSKDVSSSPLGTTPLCGDSSDLALGAPGSLSDISESKVQYLLETGQSFISSYEKLNEIPPHDSQDVQASIDTIAYSGGKSKLFVKEKNFEAGGKFRSQRQLDMGTVSPQIELLDKSNRQKRLPKGQKLDEKNETPQLHDISSTWPATGIPLQQVNSQYAPMMVNPSVPLVVNHPRHLQRPEPLQQKQFTSSPIVSPFYGNVVNYYPAPSPPMTPKEKIEKLRRQQQMRAILAIQKQQRQFGNQVSVIEHPTVEGGNVEVDESLSGFLSVDPNSSIKQDDSDRSRVAFDKSSVEESVLYRLQDTISKLDIRVRICIRDSLFRLAQSAMQRQYPSDTSSANTSNRDDILRNKDMDNHERFTRMPDVETDTNPIDRTVAHLLFHRPLEFSGKQAEAPESLASADLPPFEKKDGSLKSSAKGKFPENTQLKIPQGSKAPGVLSEDESNNTCIDTSDNAPNNKAADGVIPKIETY